MAGGMTHRSLTRGRSHKTPVQSAVIDASNREDGELSQIDWAIPVMRFVHPVKNAAGNKCRPVSEDVSKRVAYQN